MTDKNIIYKRCLPKDSNEDCDRNWKDKNKKAKVSLMKSDSRKNSNNKRDVFKKKMSTMSAIKNKNITYKHHLPEDSSDDSDSKENDRNKNLKTKPPLWKKGSSKKIKKKQESESNEITEDEKITYERYLPEDSSDDTDSNWIDEKKSMKKVSSRKRKSKQDIMEKEDENITYKRYLSEDSSDDMDSNLSDDIDSNLSDDIDSNLSDDVRDEEDEESLNNLNKKIEIIKKENESNKKTDCKESNDSDEEANKEVQLPKIPYHNGLKNKMKKHHEFSKLMGEVKLAKKNLKKLRDKERKVLGKEVKKKIPHTIESKREEDLTITNNDDEDLITEEATDSYAKYYAKQYEPKILITASDKIHGRTIKFIRELVLTLPNADAHWRNKSTIQKLMKAAIAKQYTDIIIVNEDRRAPTGLLIIHLPKGPTALFRLSNVKLCKDVKRRAKDITGHRPEIMLNNFKTRLGRVIARMFGALFHYEPEFKGRSVCTFHNQRDYIFFRHHRYQFSNADKARLKELGPRFTLRLEWLKDGAFDGDFEWIQKRHEMETSRRKFNL